MTISLFQTSDFGSAVVLKTVGLKLVNIVHGDEKRMVFVFDDPECLAEGVLNEHWEGKVTVNSREFLSHQRELKNRMYARMKDEQRV